MNIKNILVIASIMFLHLSAQAQTNQQIQDSSDGQTTVVIKEENESDLDILNSQFDLEEMGMHQVVRITTEGKAVVDGPKPSVPEQAPNVEQIEEEVVVAQVIEVKKAPQQKKVVKKTAKEKTANVGGAAVSNTKTYSSKSSNRRAAFKPHYSKKRFKKKKRKKRSKRSKKRNKCYSF